VQSAVSERDAKSLGVGFVKKMSALETAVAFVIFSVVANCAAAAATKALRCGHIIACITVSSAFVATAVATVVASTYS
jgi:hypothetical protein